MQAARISLGWMSRRPLGSSVSRRLGLVAALATAFVLALVFGAGSAAAGFLAGLAPGSPPPAIRVAVIRGGDVWLVDPGTGRETRLTVNGHGRLLGWTPDARSLFFAGGRSGSAVGTFRWQSDQGITPAVDGMRSPNGKAVVVSHLPANPSAETAVWVEAGGQRAPITPNDPNARWFSLAWSADSQRLALGRVALPPPGPPGHAIPSTAGSLWVTEGDVLAGHLRQLPLPAPESGKVGWPDAAVWSPDGRYLVVGVGPDQPCASCRADGLPFYAVPVAGGSAVPLGPALAPAATLAWAPNSSFVVLSETGGQGSLGRETYTHKQLVRVDLPSGTRTDLSHDLAWSDVEPALSPDGKTIAFARGRSASSGGTSQPATSGRPLDLIASRQIWLMDANGANPRRLTGAAGWTDEAPVWSPDGQWIVFVQWQAKPTPAAELWAIRPDGSDPQRLVANLSLPPSFISGFGYYGTFGWQNLFAVAPR